VLEKLTPYDLKTEIIDKQNTAGGGAGGWPALGVAIIIAAALH